MKKAFTLIEILIVIAIIGILAVAILIALDPVEQISRANDTKLTSATGEIRGAINRYYASKLYFPWCTATGTCIYAGTCADNTPTAFATAGTCANMVLTSLQTTGELKTSVAIDSRLQLRTGGSGSIFIVLYDPYSKAQSTQYAPVVGQSGVYTDTTCATIGTTALCPGSGTCPFCVF